MITPAYCWPNNDIANKNTYGAIYNWYAVNTGILCPTGWHVPTSLDWDILVDFLGGIGVAGNKLRESGTTHWASPNNGATNESGFTALPGPVTNVVQSGMWWTSTFGGALDDGTKSRAWFYYMTESGLADLRMSAELVNSVRCLKD